MRAIMLDVAVTLTSLLWGTLLLRCYVFGFLAAFLVTGIRDLGVRRTLAFLVWGWAVAFACEFASTRVGIPFGLYHYTGTTRGAELYVSNVPFFDSLSFTFLAYASFCLARAAIGERSRPRLAGLAGILMMVLDIVIDPLAVRGDRWFLGRIFYYPEGGIYFGVPLSNFAGWLIVGWLIVGGFLLAGRRSPIGRSPRAGVGLYYGVLFFNLAMSAWIGEPGLVAAGILLHAAVVLLLYGVVTARTAEPAPDRTESSPPEGRRGARLAPWGWRKRGLIEP
jgi:putative membrane protein